MDLGISGKTALVLGAGGGLGRAIALSLGREGAAVAGADINPDALAETSALATEQGIDVSPIPMDLTDVESIHAGVEAVRSKLGDISILINMTGGPPPTAARNTGSEQWRAGFDTLLAPVYHVTSLVLEGMIDQGWGRVITSTSSGVISPIPHLGISNSLRSALVSWSKTLAAEVAPYGVTANVVVPGRIATERIISLDHAKATREGRTVDDVVRDSVASIPAGRYGAPEEYGDVVAFLASERAAFMTGSVIRVDGGMIPSVY